MNPPLPPQTTVLSTLTPKEVNKIRSDLIQHYDEVLSGIQTDVFNPDSRIRFEDIYTNLYLLKEVEKKVGDNDLDLPIRHPFFADFDAHDERRARKQKLHLPDDEFRQLITPGQPPYRVLLVGEAGVGKTTFLAKLANDWMNGTDFQDIELLFRISLREAEKTETFGDVVQKYLSDTAAYGTRLDEYIKTNQHRAMLLLDGLDEFDGDITGNTHNNVLAKIMGGDKYKECVVIITTRPWRADKILDLPHFEKRFTFVSVEGFAKENMEDYAEKFFHSDQGMAASLKQFLAEDNERGGVFSTIMAPFPIFLAMLCHVWKNETTRKKAMKLQTVSQLTNLMVHVLKEHYALKADESGQGRLYDEHIHNASISLPAVGNVAYPHDPSVATRQFVLDEGDFVNCKESFKTVCQIGLVTRDKTVAPMQVRQMEGRRYIVEYRIPHLLILDFLAATYLASIQHANAPEFEDKLKELIAGSRSNIDKFEYLWYFTAAQGKDVGRAVLDVLSQEVANREFIVRVAFECHDKDVITPVMRTVLSNRALRLKEKRSLAAHLYVLDTAPSLVSGNMYSRLPILHINITKHFPSRLHIIFRWIEISKVLSSVGEQVL